MEWIIALIIVIFGFGLVKGIHALQKNTDTDKVKQIQPKGRLSKEDIQQQFTLLSVKKPPKDLSSVGAMCYSPVLLPQHADYICPDDGEKTVYNVSMAEFIAWELPKIRAMIPKLKEQGLDISLDEHELCKVCSPNVTDPVISIIISYGNDLHSMQIDNARDLTLMYEFVTGSLIHTDERDAETPLKTYLPRLQQLFGIQLKE